MNDGEMDDGMSLKYRKSRMQWLKWGIQGGGTLRKDVERRAKGSGTHVSIFKGGG